MRRNLPVRDCVLPTDVPMTFAALRLCSVGYHFVTVSDLPFCDCPTDIPTYQATFQ